ncbi:MAG: SusC/RagA family TonB-linked outer membrane protein [Parabacteroides sp.]|nr:SusC/RagA family TonB-linked outer membrane protein [Parabacteroides sp.]
MDPKQSPTSGKIIGQVLDEKGEPIVGANIIEKSTSNGVITDLDGRFGLNISPNAILQISYIGYISQEVKVAGNKMIQVTLVEDSKALSEVIVTALGIKREEKALGYAVQKVNGASFETVKSVDFSSSLTGKVAGLNVKISPEFNDEPVLSLRGETPLLVVDGVPYKNVSLRDISSDDIESVDVLKGASASALYGARGGAGAIMVTTKKAKEEGLSITVNSSTMFKAGFLKFPEVQTAYSSGRGGKYGSGDVVWGDKLDMGRKATMYNPQTYEWEEMELTSKGKDNFKNFLESSFVTNNNISISQRGKYGSFRTSLSHVYNKGQYENTKLHKLTYSVNGELKLGDFEFQGGLTYNNRFYPQNYGTGFYGGGSYMYNIVVWMGTEYDIRDFRNYWVKPGQEQNWMDKTWYDNPWMAANENIHSDNYHMTNGYLSANYEFTPWLKASFRTGLDVYTGREEWRNPIGACGGWSKNGYYGLKKRGGLSSNTDFMLLADKAWGDWRVDGFIGGTVYYYNSDTLLGETSNGLSVPEFYSLKASVDPTRVSSDYYRKQVNSIYGKASVSWRNTVFLDVTGRNDWSSTLAKDSRSYFYPSISGSVILSEFFRNPDWLSMWKIRSSWTQTKSDLGVYDTNTAYSTSINIWDGMNGAYYPESVRGTNVLPQTSNSFELGMAAHFLKNRLWMDVTYYNKLSYNFAKYAGVSPTSGFNSTLINIDEELLRKGVEVTVGAKPIQNKDFQWNLMANWALDRNTYNKIDPVYSAKKDWVNAGERWDWIEINDWVRDPSGNIVHENGLPVKSPYKTKLGNSDPDWFFGLSNTFKYKDFSMNIAIDGRIGGVAYSWTNQILWNAGSHIESDNQWRYDEVVNGKKNYVGEGVKILSGSVEYDTDGKIIKDTRVFAPNDTEVSYEAYVQSYHSWVGEGRPQNYLKQTFVKLREVSITYDLPGSVCSKLGMVSASVSAIGNNLFVWTKDFKYADPDRGKEELASPSIRMVGFNLKVNF